MGKNNELSVTASAPLLGTKWPISLANMNSGVT